MKTMPISEFKARALQVIDEIAKTRDGIVVTKRGKPIAQVLPYRETTKRAKPGKLARYLVREGDIVSPLGEKEWEVTR